MSVYTYTLRTKTQNVQLDSGEIVKVHILGYLCHTNAYECNFAFPGEYGYRRAKTLASCVERTRQRWVEKGPVYFMFEKPGVGDCVYKAEDASLVAVYNDSEGFDKERVSLVGCLNKRTRRAWTLTRGEG